MPQPWHARPACRPEGTRHRRHCPPLPPALCTRGPSAPSATSSVCAGGFTGTPAALGAVPKSRSRVFTVVTRRSLFLVRSANRVSGTRVVIGPGQAGLEVVVGDLRAHRAHLPRPRPLQLMLLLHPLPHRPPVPPPLPPAPPSLPAPPGWPYAGPCGGGHWCRGHRSSVSFQGRPKTSPTATEQVASNMPRHHTLPDKQRQCSPTSADQNDPLTSKTREDPCGTGHEVHPFCKTRLSQSAHCSTRPRGPNTLFFRQFDWNFFLFVTEGWVACLSLS